MKFLLFLLWSLPVLGMDKPNINVKIDIKNETPKHHHHHHKKDDKKDDVCVACGTIFKATAKAIISFLI